MALTGSNGTGGANYYINEGTVKSVAVNYNVPNKSDDTKIKDVELTIILEMTKANGEKFDKTIYISGNYKKNEITSQVEDWGSAFKVRSFFNAVGLTKWSTDDFGILPSSIAEQAIGKRLFIIKYKSLDDQGELLYRTYNMVGKSAESIEKMFLKDAAGDYPPYKYDPVVEEKDVFQDAITAQGGNV